MHTLILDVSHKRLDTILNEKEKCSELFVEVNSEKEKNYQGKREEASKSSEDVSVGAQCSSTQ